MSAKGVGAPAAAARPTAFSQGSPGQAAPGHVRSCYGATLSSSKEPHDLALLRFGFRLTSAASSGVVYRQCHRRRAVAVRTPGIRTTIDQCTNSCCTTSAHGTMQRRNSALVGRVGIGARLDQVRDRRCLCLGIPYGETRMALGGVVQRLRAAAILHADVGTRGY
jgi:hypothetical protein